MSKLTLAITSDCHIYDWMQHSTFDEYGRPSRLTDYLHLADDFYEFSKSIKADVNILAGDILQSPTVRPRVLDVAGDFLRRVSQDTLTVVTYGQHDLDVKGNNISKPNCILTELCKGINNVSFYDENTSVVINDYKFVICPWNPDHDLPRAEEADVFIGHGVVSGCTDHQNYMFSSGFKQSDLFNNYRLSIIGDIHNGQVFQGESSKILIPGSSLCNNYKDCPTVGFWRAVIDENTVELKFYPLSEISSHRYHKFIIANDESITPDEFTHVRVAGVKSSKVSKSKQSAVSNIDLITAATSIINEAKLDYGDSTIDVFKSYVEKLKSSVLNVVKRAQILTLDAQNFLSIDKFSLDFREIKRDLILCGGNGEGKSTVCEAFYWALTGKTTKSISAANVSNKYLKDGNTSVTITLDIDGDSLSISRYRLNGSPKLIISYNGSEIVKSSVADTQAELYKILGLNDEEIRLLCYFPAQGSTLFGDLTASNRYSTVSKIIGLSELDDLMNLVSVDLKELEVTHASSTQKLQYVRSQRQKDIEDLERIKSESADKSTSAKRSIEIESRLSILENTVKSIDLKSLTDQVDPLNSEIYELSKLIDDKKLEIKNFKTKKSDLANKLATEKSKLLSVHTSGVCFTCGQSLSDKKVLNDLKVVVNDLNIKLKSLDDSVIINLESEIVGLGTKKSQLADKVRYIKSQISDATSSNSEINNLRKELASLRPVDNSATISLLKSRIDSFEIDISVAETQNSVCSKSLDILRWISKNLLKRNSELYVRMIERASGIIQGQIDSVTEGCTFSITLNKDFTIEAKFGHSYLEYDLLSSGQKRVVDVVMMVSLNNAYALLNNIDNGVLGIAIFDEVLSYLDERYIEELRGVLDNSRAAKLVVITHDTKLMTMFTDRIVVSMKNGISNYETSWR